MRITILYSTPTERLSDSQFSVTDEDTTKSAKIFAKSLKKSGYTVSLFPLSSTDPDAVSQIKADCIVNLIEWTGSDLPAAKRAYTLLDQMNIPYSGSTWNGYLWSSEKTLMKKKFEETQILNPKNIILSQEKPIAETVFSHLTYPLIVKLASDHCSIGLSRDSIVHGFEQGKKQVMRMMKQFHEDVLVEEFITGREFQVAAIEKNGEIIMLPPTEITFEKPEELNFLTFEGRWEENHPDFQMAKMIINTDLPTSVYDHMKSEITRAFVSFELHDYARFDLRLRGEEIFFLEANANPGVDDSLETGVTLAAHAAGIEFDELLTTIIDSCLQRNR